MKDKAAEAMDLAYEKGAALCMLQPASNMNIGNHAYKYRFKRGMMLQLWDRLSVVAKHDLIQATSDHVCPFVDCKSFWFRFC